MVTCLPRDGTDIQSSMDSESCAYFTVPFLDCMGIVSGHWVEQLLDPHFFFILLGVPRKSTADFLPSWHSSHICLRMSLLYSLQALYCFWHYTTEVLLVFQLLHPNLVYMESLEVTLDSWTSFISSQWLLSFLVLLSASLFSFTHRHFQPGNTSSSYSSVCVLGSCYPFELSMHL